MASVSVSSLHRPTLSIMSPSRDSVAFTSTKGLLNGPGQNNCFLNSAVQGTVSRIDHEEMLSRKRLVNANNEIYNKQEKLRSKMLNDAERLIDEIVASKTCREVAISVQIAIEFSIIHARLFKGCVLQDKFEGIDSLMMQFGDYSSEAKNCADTCDETAIVDLWNRVVMLSKDLEVKIAATSKLVKTCSEKKAQEIANLLAYTKGIWQRCVRGWRKIKNRK